MSVTLPLVVFSSMLLAQPGPERVTSVQGKLILHEEFASKVLDNKRTIRVWLPADYETNPKKKFPVLYMMDGQNCFDGMTSYIPNKEWRADETVTSLSSSGLLRSMIVVGVDNAQADRANEYLPIEISWQKDQKAGGKADKFGDFLTTELMPFLRSKYRMETGAGSTGICGSSFGGIISLHLAATRPNVFGRIIAMSPSLWVGDGWSIRQVEGLPKKTNQRIWIDMGTAEGRDLDKQLGRLSTAFQNKGWVLGKDLAAVIDSGSQHNEEAWARRLDAALMFTFGK